jgi:hypothetical protein
VWSTSLVRRLADRQLGLRTDVVYATFRGAVREHVPVARGASAASFARFVAPARVCRAPGRLHTLAAAAERSAQLSNAVSALDLMPYALCLMPYALCLMPYASCFG